jgi:hypothetical protein
VTYFDYWATKSMETQYRHHAAKYGGIAAVLQISMNVRKLNDGQYYNLGGWSMWRDTLNPHGKLRMWK